MGPRYNVTGTLMMFDKDNNKYIKLVNIKDVGVIETNSVSEDNGSDFPLNLTDTFSGSFELILPKCSRKRFVKKLMSIGIQRNIANRCAAVCIENKIPYKVRLLYAQLLLGEIFQ